MRKRFLLFISFVLIGFTTIQPAEAKGKWDYILNDYSTKQEQQCVVNYLKYIDKGLKDTWYTPIYKKPNSRGVIFYLNKNGLVSSIDIRNSAKGEGKNPYMLSYDNHIKSYFSELKFKPFPSCIKKKELMLGYMFLSNYTYFGTFFGYGAFVENKGERIYNYTVNPPEGI